MYPSKGLVSAIALASPDAIFFRRTTEKVIALTIDDVPTAEQSGYSSAQFILDAIAAHNRQLPNSVGRARATFFIIGSQLTQGSTILHQMLAQGHELGNHGMHDHFHVSLSASAFEDELWRSHQLLTEDTAARVRWFRPGRGVFKPAMVATLRRMQPHGYQPQMALASMVPLDTRREFMYPAFTLRYVSRFVFPGAILVLHGGSDERDRNTAVVLKTLLPQLYAMGYRVVTLSQLFASP